MELRTSLTSTYACAVTSGEWNYADAVLLRSYFLQKNKILYIHHARDIF